MRWLITMLALTVTACGPDTRICEERIEMSVREYMYLCEAGVMLPSDHDIIPFYKLLIGPKGWVSIERWNGRCMVEGEL